MQHLTQLIADAKRKRQEQVLQEQQQQQQAARESQRQRQEAAAAGAGGGGGEWGNRKALAGGGKGGFSSASRRLLASFSSVSDGWSAYSPAHGGPSPGSGPGDKHQEEEEGDERAGQPIMLLSCFKWEMRKGWDVLLAAYLQVGRPRIESGLELGLRPPNRGGAEASHAPRKDIKQALGRPPVPAPHRVIM